MNNEEKQLKIAIGSDHRGFHAKEKLINYFSALGYEIEDFGTKTEEPCNYTKYAEDVARAVASKKYNRGILLCKTGIGMSIAANKIHGIRAALGYNKYVAELARKHNDANILCLGTAFHSFEKLKEITYTFLTTDFSYEERHIERIKEIHELEKL